MDVILKYKVANATAQNFPAKASVGGREMAVEVPGIVVEAVSDDESMGHTFRFVPEDLEAALAAFAPGADLTVSLSV